MVDRLRDPLASVVELADVADEVGDLDRDAPRGLEPRGAVARTRWTTGRRQTAGVARTRQRARRASRANRGRRRAFPRWSGPPRRGSRPARRASRGSRGSRTSRCRRASSRRCAWRSGPRGGSSRTVAPPTTRTASRPARRNARVRGMRSLRDTGDEASSTEGSALSMRVMTPVSSAFLGLPELARRADVRKVEVARRPRGGGLGLLGPPPPSRTWGKRRPPAAAGRRSRGTMRRRSARCAGSRLWSHGSGGR